MLSIAQLVMLLKCWLGNPSTGGGVLVSPRTATNSARVGCNGVNTLADCEFTDYSDDGNSGHVSGYTAVANGPLYSLTYTAGSGGHQLYHGCAPVVTSADTFAQWWQDGSWESDGTTPGQHAIGTLELAPTSLTRVSGSTALATALTRVTEFRIVHTNDPDYRGDIIAASFGVDNIRAVPEPAALATVAAASLPLLLRRRRRI